MSDLVDLVAALTRSIDSGSILIAAGLFMRLSAFVFFLPGIGEKSIPVRTRLVAAAAFTVVLFPFISTVTLLPEDISFRLVAATLFAEAINGLLLGFATRIFIFVLQLTGAMIAQSLSLSQLFGPTVGFDAEAPFTTILVMAGLAIAVASGLHFHAAAAVGASFEILAFGQLPGAAEIAEWSALRTGAAFMQAFALAAPFVLLGFLYSIALSAASRAMPQLPAAFVGAPMITLAGLILFAAAAPLLLLDWLHTFQDALIDLFSVAS